MGQFLQCYFGLSICQRRRLLPHRQALIGLGSIFEFETDSARRFALWSLLYMLGQAPDLDVAFDEESDRDAARNLMDLLAASGD